MPQNEIILPQRKGKILGYWISQAAKWRQEGHSVVAGSVDDFVHVINDADTYAKLDAAIRWFYKVIGSGS